MDKQELLERFDELGENDGRLRKAFTLLAEASAKSATEFLECLEGCNEYNNYLSENEAIAITKALRNDDGTTGAKWSPDTLFAKVESLGAPIENAGYYNKWALYATMNMESSDVGKVIKKWTDSDADKYAEACYDLAVARLQDIDRLKFVRKYFCLE